MKFSELHVGERFWCRDNLLYMKINPIQEGIIEKYCYPEINSVILWPEELTGKTEYIEPDEFVVFAFGSEE